MLLIIIYTLFCYGFASVNDDGEKWDFRDWVILFLAPVTTPISIGKMFGEIVNEVLKEDEK